MVSTAPKVLVVEDEPAQREVLIYNLQADGIAALSTGDGDEAICMVDEHQPDVILLDWMLPHLSGIEICRQLKTNPKTCAIPVIMMSARAEEVDRIRGLETGADDYVVKPYSVAELMARVRAALRRVRPSAVGEVITHGDITLDGASFRVHRAGAEIKLGPTEFQLLACFMERAGRVLSRDQLLDLVWGRDIHVDIRTVDVHVGRLRKALQKGGSIDPIRTVRGAGYSMEKL